MTGPGGPPSSPGHRHRLGWVGGCWLGRQHCMGKKSRDSRNLARITAGHRNNPAHRGVFCSKCLQTCWNLLVLKPAARNTTPGSLHPHPAPSFSSASPTPPFLGFRADLVVKQIQRQLLQLHQEAEALCQALGAGSASVRRASLRLGRVDGMRSCCC